MSYVPQIMPNQTTTGIVTNLVNQKFAATAEYANTAFNTAMTFLNDIISLIQNIVDIDTDVDIHHINFRPSFNISSYLRDIPVAPDITYPALPTDSFSYTEDAYISALLDLLKTKLTSILNGVSILDPAVENAIFQRETERDELVLQESKDRLASDWSERNLELPGGGLFNSFLQVDVEYLNKRLDKSRAIAEETRKIEIENIRLAIQESRQIENVLMDYKNKYWDRKLQAASKVLEQALAIFNAAIELVKTKATVYGAEVSAFASYIGALVAAANIEVMVIRGKMEYTVAEANIRIEQIKAEIEEMKAASGIAVNATDAGAKVAAQLAASALSAVSVGANLKVDNSQAVNASIQAEEQWNHNISSEE